MRDAGAAGTATPAPSRKASGGRKAQAGDSRPATPVTPAITAAVPRNQSGASAAAADSASVEPKSRMTRSRSRSVGMAGMANGGASDAAAAAAGGGQMRGRQRSASAVADAAAAEEPEVVDLCGTSSDRCDGDAAASPEASDSDEGMDSDENLPVVREVPFRCSASLCSTKSVLCQGSSCSYSISSVWSQSCTFPRLRCP